MKRMIEYGFLNYKTVLEDSQREYIKRGIFTSRAVFKTEGASVDIGSEKTEKAGGTVDARSGRDLSNRKDYLNINYFYLADLLFVVLDTMYDSDGQFLNNAQDFKFLLTSFDYIDPIDLKSKSINIGSIPISSELFFEWFTENVIKQERKSYPVMFFVRDLVKFLITDIMLESCFSASLDKSLHFKTTNFLGLKVGDGRTVDPFTTMNASPYIDVGAEYLSNRLPLKIEDGGAPPETKDFINYITLYVEAPRLIDNKTGKKEEDGKRGILHFQIGRDKGILKKLKFSKTDMQYIREARFFRHGNDGLLQLSAVYKASLEMIGNTLYYPGTEVFLDPRGLLGAGDDFDPTNKKSTANKLGFGGYHLVTRVNSTISPGRFTTSMDAMFSYSGDGDPRSKVIGSNQDVVNDSEKKEDIKEVVSSDVFTRDNFCKAVSNDLFAQAVDISIGQQSEYESISKKPNITGKPQ